MKNSVSIFLLSLSLFFVACNNSEKSKTREERVKEVVEKINNTPEWKEKVAKKAEGWGMSLDSAIYNDAVWVIDDLDGLHKK